MRKKLTDLFISGETRETKHGSAKFANWIAPDYTSL